MPNRLQVSELLHDATNLAPIEFGLDTRGPMLPQGLVSGVQLETVLRDLSQIHGFVRFDALPIPFRAVATDLVTGKAVVLSQGDVLTPADLAPPAPGPATTPNADDLNLARSERAMVEAALKRHGVDTSFVERLA